MTFWSATLTVLLYVWDALKEWLYIFISPMENLEILWIIIPIWINWFFSEWFQEKKGTSFGNAISNGAVPLYIGIDWTRHLTRLVTAGTLEFSLMLVLKYLLCVVAILYGFSIIFFGIRAKKFIHFYGRIRETTYVMVVFSPVIYGIINLSWKFLLLIIIFFPVYYYFIELLAKYTPDPRIYKFDKGKKEELETPALGEEVPGLSEPLDKNIKF